MSSLMVFFILFIEKGGIEGVVGAFLVKLFLGKDLKCRQKETATIKIAAASPLYQNGTNGLHKKPVLVLKTYFHRHTLNRLCLIWNSVSLTRY